MRDSMLGSVWGVAITLFMIVAIASSPAAPALAQEQRRMQIDEVVVSAQRRDEDMQSVAIAVSAFSEEELSSRRIDGLGSLANRTPGLAIGEFTPSLPQVYIRGVGSNERGAAADPSTAVFIDEVYVGRVSGWTANLFDLERVEVLRGPQGTLYGKNVVGGAINLISRKPTEFFEAEVGASVGSFNLREFRGMVSGPLSDNLFAKYAFSTKTRDGYLKSLVGDFPEAFPTTDPGALGSFDQLNRDMEFHRASLRWQPSDVLEVNLSFDNSTLDENAPNFKSVGSTVLAQAAAGLVENDQKRIRRNLNRQPARTKVETTGFSARADYDFDWGTLTSISAYREADNITQGCCNYSSLEDVAFLASSPTAPAGGQTAFSSSVGNFQDETSDQISQELRLSSAGTGPLEWVAGLYYLREEVDRTESFDFGLARFDGDGGFVVVLPPSVGSGASVARTESVAVFGQASWNVNEKLRLTAGARWTEDKRRISTVAQAGGLLYQEDFEVSRKDSWDEVTPRFAIDYQFSEQLFLYALASRGFKSGGYQGVVPRLETTVPFGPEFAWLYEVGFKSDFLDRRARVNVAAFLTDYTDLQVRQSLIPDDSETDTVINIVQNAADSEIRGVELEFVFLPLPGLTLSGTYAYLDATFSEFFAPTGFRTATGVDINQRKGNRLRNAPKHSLGLMAQYESTLRSGMRLINQLDWRYTSRNFQDPDNSVVSSIPAHSLLDARVTLLSADERWEFSLWAENLLDEDYFIHGFPSAGGGTMTPGAPRMVGVTLRWRS